MLHSLGKSLSLALLWAALAWGAQAQCLPQTPQPTGAPANEVIQTFPADSQHETAWKVRFGYGIGKGLYITGAWFKRTSKEGWIKILNDARLADIFAPYDTGAPRYFDLTGYKFRLVPVSTADLGACGQVLSDVVVKEVVDRGILWKDDQQGRRGQELILWSTLDASNYNYIMRYGFQDDGTITFRIAATAHNLPGLVHVAHMHEGLWRIDMDLGGAAHNSALVMRHNQSEESRKADTSIEPFNNGVEGAIDWNPEEFTQVRIQDEVLKNAQGKPISYDLLPFRAGSQRHPEPFSQHDFWVTKNHPDELFYEELPTYISNQESIQNTDIVLWYLSSVYHLPRSEDGKPYVIPIGSGYSVLRGVALAMWSGFDLRPRDFFDETPLYP